MCKFATLFVTNQLIQILNVLDRKLERKLVKKPKTLVTTSPFQTRDVLNRVAAVKLKRNVST